MAQKPFLALVIPAEAEQKDKPPGRPPGQGVPPGQQPGGPVGPGQGFLPHPSHPVVIEPPPDIPDLPEGSKLVLVWDGENWQWAVTGLDPTQPIQPTPAPKR